MGYPSELRPGGAPPTNKVRDANEVPSSSLAAYQNLTGKRGWSPTFVRSFFRQGTLLGERGLVTDLRPHPLLPSLEADDDEEREDDEEDDEAERGDQ